MRIGVVGKGGVGKTTVSALLARAYRGRGRRVVAVDTDSNPNLGLSLGLSLAETEAVPTLPRATVVADAGGAGAEDLVAEYGRATPAGVTLLSALRVTEAGGGCTCSGHATVRSLLADELAARADVAIVDMEAGLEHLSRSGGTLAYADVLLVVMEPSRKSVVTAARTRALAEELGIPRTLGVGNKARLADDADFLAEACAAEGVELAGVLPHADAIRVADREARAVGEELPDELAAALDRIVAAVDGGTHAAAAAAT